MDVRQNNTEASQTYARAESFLSWNVSTLFYGGQVKPNWIGKGDRFWYLSRSRGGAEFLLVDIPGRLRLPAFDHVRLAASLSAASGRACESVKLPFEAFEFADGERAIQFDAFGRSWGSVLASGETAPIEKDSGALPGELLSPDGKWGAYTDDDNLHVRNTGSGEAFPLTVDGEPYWNYAAASDSTIALAGGFGKAPRKPVALWSPDSKRILTHRMDQRGLRELHMLQNVPTDGSLRPVLHSYRYAIGGDEDIGQEQIAVLDTEERTCVFAQYEPLPLGVRSSFEPNLAWWGEDGRRAYLVFVERGSRGMRLCEIDPETGRTREIITERGRTYVEPNLGGQWPNVRILGNGREAIWFSERDGWGHLYLYDARTGELRNQITRGPWVVRDILRVDEESRQIFFTAGGREQGRDPYLRHLYRASLDGGEPELLTPEDADHDVTFSPCGRFFVDNYSRVDLTPESVLRSRDGELVLELGKADLGDLMETGWKFPEPFSVKARDGVTDIYGLVCRPTSFDPAKSYPVIDAIYGAPSDNNTIKSFPLDTLSGGVFWDLQAMAELGFIVVSIDGLGTPYRSKAFHDHSYGKMEDCGLEDHIVGLRQLARRDPSMDLSRVGIFGHSYGGYAATRAILAYPGFYKVAISSSGNQDNRLFLPFWIEKYQGCPAGESYDRQANFSLAHNLEGHLLLIHGDMDSIVHPALTFQMVDALIKANKDFDLLILPNRVHQHYRDVYFLRRKWDYLMMHLRSETPPQGYQIQPPPPQV